MKSTLKKIVILFSFVPVAFFAAAQKNKPKAVQEIRVPMQPAFWKYDPTGVEFITQDNVQAIHIKKPAPLILKDRQFSNGTIEYDVALRQGFPGIWFRMSDDRKNGEHFYIRYFGTTSPESRTTLQYCAVIDDLSMWNLTDEYQAGATLKIPGWNHVKLVIYGKQMKAYVNDMSRPVMIVPGLEGGRTTGGIHFMGGEVTIANFVIKPDAVEDLDSAQGYISTYNDPRYLRNWQVSASSDFAYGKEVVPPSLLGNRVQSTLPDSTTKWTAITAGDRGVVNLSRLYGKADNFGRRLAWLKTTILSDKVQERTLHLGFCDEIWLFVNGQALYTDKNYYGTPGQKFPRGRCTIENATVRIPLQQGKNEILIGLANYFYGWGIIARFDDMDGVHLPR